MQSIIKIKFHFESKIRSICFRYSELRLFIFDKKYRNELKKNNEPIFVKVNSIKRGAR